MKFHLVHRIMYNHIVTVTILPNDIIPTRNFVKAFYDLLRSYKQRGIKVLLGFGGWNDSAGDKYSRMVSNTTSRRAFVAHALGFIEANGFDGLDLFWQWPVCWRVRITKFSLYSC